MRTPPSPSPRSRPPATAWRPPKARTTPTGSALVVLLVLASCASGAAAAETADDTTTAAQTFISEQVTHPAGRLPDAAHRGEDQDRPGAKAPHDRDEIMLTSDEQPSGPEPRESHLASVFPEFVDNLKKSRDISVEESGLRENPTGIVDEADFAVLNERGEVETVGRADDLERALLGAQEAAAKADVAFSGPTTLMLFNIFTPDEIDFLSQLVGEDVVKELKDEVKKEDDDEEEHFETRETLLKYNPPHLHVGSGDDAAVDSEHTSEQPKNEFPSSQGNETRQASTTTEHPASTTRASLEAYKKPELIEANATPVPHLEEEGEKPHSVADERRQKVETLLQRLSDKYKRRTVEQKQSGKEESKEEAEKTLHMKTMIDNLSQRLAAMRPGMNRIDLAALRDGPTLATTTSRPSTTPENVPLSVVESMLGERLKDMSVGVHRINLDSMVDLHGLRVVKESNVDAGLVAVSTPASPISSTEAALLAAHAPSEPEGPPSDDDKNLPKRQASVHPKLRFQRPEPNLVHRPSSNLKSYITPSTEAPTASTASYREKQLIDRYKDSDYWQPPSPDSHYHADSYLVYSPDNLKGETKALPPYEFPASFPAPHPTIAAVVTTTTSGTYAMATPTPVYRVNPETPSSDPRAKLPRFEADYVQSNSYRKPIGEPKKSGRQYDGEVTLFPPPSPGYKQPSIQFAAQSLHAEKAADAVASHIEVTPKNTPQQHASYPSVASYDAMTPHPEDVRSLPQTLYTTTVPSPNYDTPTATPTPQAYHQSTTKHAVLSKAHYGSCPVTPKKPEYECQGTSHTCWSEGVRDLDCPLSGLCCFDGCANTCLPVDYSGDYAEYPAPTTAASYSADPSHASAAHHHSTLHIAATEKPPQVSSPVPLQSYAPPDYRPSITPVPLAYSPPTPTPTYHVSHEKSPAALSKAHYGSCPSVPKKPEYLCHGSSHTCWSAGVRDLDCPLSALCCFDGCANTCLPADYEPSNPYAAVSTASPPPISASTVASSYAHPSHHLFSSGTTTASPYSKSISPHSPYVSTTAAPHAHLAPVHVVSLPPAPPPAYSTPAPVYSSPPPAYSSPAPVYTTPSPVYTTPSPVYTTPSPVYTTPSPVYTTPSPVYTTPSPVYTTPSPVYTTPSPVYTTPSPVYSTPSPVYSTPAPVYHVAPPAEHHHPKLSKAHHGHCPAVDRKPEHLCYGSSHTCWSAGVRDLDCPLSGLCCFDGCANTCLPLNYGEASLPELAIEAVIAAAASVPHKVLPLLQTTMAPPEKEYQPAAAAAHMTTLRPPIYESTPPPGYQAMSTTYAPPSRDYVPHMSTTLSPPVNSYMAHMMSTIAPPHHEYASPQASDYAHVSSTLAPPSQGYHAPSHVLMQPPSLEYKAHAPASMTYMTPPEKGYAPPKLPSEVHPPVAAYEAPASGYQPEHMTHLLPPSKEYSASKPVELHSACPSRPKRDSCAHPTHHQCWSPGVPDLDCPGSGLCCFDGCANVCINGLHGHAHSVVGPAYSYQLHHVSYHVPPHNKYLVPASEYIPYDVVHNHKGSLIDLGHEYKAQSHSAHALKDASAPPQEYLPPKYLPPTPSKEYAPPKEYAIANEYRNEYAHPKTIYTPPIADYSAPKPVEYSAPKPSYLPPEHSYSPPVLDHSAYEPPSREFAAPHLYHREMLAPSKGYAPPLEPYQQPVEDYAPVLAGNFKSHIAIDLEGTVPVQKHDGISNKSLDVVDEIVLEDAGHLPPNHFEPPLKDYGSPKLSNTLEIPSKGYLPPMDSLLPPSQEYGAGLVPEKGMNPPTSEYSPPKDKSEPHPTLFYPPSKDYQPGTDNALEPPKKGYLPPKVTAAPSQEYEPPAKVVAIPTLEQILKAPVEKYLPPNKGEVHLEHYKTPEKEYESPREAHKLELYSTPSKGYLPPKESPSKGYLPPKDLTPKQSYEPPTKEYGPSVHLKQDYEAPEKGYLPPKELALKQSYEPPTKEYGPSVDLKQGYEAPKKGYLPPKELTPKQSYEPPSKEYGSSVHLKQDYEAPEKGYLPPKELVPKQSYEPPSKEYGSSVHLKQDYEAPEKGYLPPKELVPKQFYEPPSKEYGSSVHLKQDYEAPEKGYLPPKELTPKQSYEPPTKEYGSSVHLTKDYEAPEKGYLPPKELALKQSYEPPTKEYGPSVDLKQGYEAPSKEYLPPKGLHKLQEYETPTKGYLPPKLPSQSYEHPTKEYLPPGPEKSYEAPSKGYLPPKEPIKLQEYDPPNKGYLPPKVDVAYIPPEKGYLPPKDSAHYSTPSKEYVPPFTEQLSDHYTPPEKDFSSLLSPGHLLGFEPPSKDYGAPGLAHPPPQSIEPPKASYLPPSPHDHYSPPAKDFSEADKLSQQFSPPSFEPPPPDLNLHLLPPIGVPEKHVVSPPSKDFLAPDKVVAPALGFLPPPADLLRPGTEVVINGKHFPVESQSLHAQHPAKPNLINIQINMPKENHPEDHLKQISPPLGDFLPPPGPLFLGEHGSTLDAIMLPEQTYLPPSVEYGPPKEYGPPRVEYGPPKAHHEGPSTSYELPKAEYGPPKVDLATSYEPPRAEYGPPKIALPTSYEPPKADYGPPKTDYGAPKVEYGLPTSYEAPKTEYGVPSGIVPPKLSYLPPPARDKPQYVAPPPRAVVPPPPPPELVAPLSVEVLNSQVLLPTAQQHNNHYLPPKTPHDVPKNFLRPGDVPDGVLEPPPPPPPLVVDPDAEKLSGAPEPFLGLAKLKNATSDDDVDGDDESEVTTKEEEKKPSTIIRLPPMPTEAPNNVFPLIEKLSPELIQKLRDSQTGGNGNGVGGGKGFIPGKPGVDYPDFKVIPATEFTCENFILEGFYADTFTSCQVFHVCESGRRQSSFICPKGTIFNQKHRVCDWWYNVKCEDSAEFYDLNLDLILLEKEKATTAEKLRVPPPIDPLAFLGGGGGSLDIWPEEELGLGGALASDSGEDAGDLGDLLDELGLARLGFQDRSDDGEDDDDILATTDSLSTDDSSSDAVLPVKGATKFEDLLGLHGRENGTAAAVKTTSGAFRTVKGSSAGGRRRRRKQSPRRRDRARSSKVSRKAGATHQRKKSAEETERMSICQLMHICGGAGQDSEGQPSSAVVSVVDGGKNLRLGEKTAIEVAALLSESSAAKPASPAIDFNAGENVGGKSGLARSDKSPRRHGEKLLPMSSISFEPYSDSPSLRNPKMMQEDSSALFRLAADNMDTDAKGWLPLGLPSAFSDREDDGGWMPMLERPDAVRD